MNEISAFRTETPESPLFSSAMQGHREKTAIDELRSGLSPDNEFAYTFILGGGGTSSL